MAETLTLPGVAGTYAIGLSWWHEGKQKQPKKTLHKRSLEHKSRWGVARKLGADSLQTGLCAPIPGVKSARSVRPLAAIAADAHRQPWHGLFEIGDDRYWYIAVRDANGIIPEGDLVGTREQMERVLNRHSEDLDWNECIEGNREDLARIVRATPNPPSLRDVQASLWKPIAAAVGVLTVIAGAGTGYWLWRERQLEAQRQAEQARQRAVQAALAAQRAAEAKILPWTKLPMSAEVIESCARAWQGRDHWQKGWAVTTWRCKPQAQSTAIDVGWGRQGGLAADAPGTLSADGESSSTSSSTSSAFSPPSPQALASDVAQRLTWTFVQTHGLALRMQAPVAPPPLPGNASGKDAPPPDPWVASSAEFSLPYPPWKGLTEAFDAVPALRISEIGYDAKKGQWTVTGTLYGLRGAAVAAASVSSASASVAQLGVSAPQGGLHGHP